MLDPSFTAISFVVTCDFWLFFSREMLLLAWMQEARQTIKVPYTYNHVFFIFRARLARLVPMEPWSMWCRRWELASPDFLVMITL
jgi:hypothetical protein